MESVSQVLAAGGPTARLALAAGGVGCVVGLALIGGALVGVRSGTLRGLAFGCVGLSMVSTGLGIWGALRQRSTGERAASELRASTAERVTHNAWLAAQANLSAALPAAGPPVALALAGFVLAARRRLRESHARPAPGPVVPIVLLLAASWSWGLGVRLWRQPVPGRELDDASWKVLELSDALDAGEWNRCFSTSWSLGAATPAHALPAHAENQRRCADHFSATADLGRLLEAAWFDGPAARDAVARRLAEVSPPAAPPTPETTPPPAPIEATAPARPDPALALLERKLGPCLKRRSRVELTVTITNAGRVELPPRAAKCLRAAAARMKLPAGNPRSLDVQLK